eukprot:g31052.t1
MRRREDRGCIFPAVGHGSALCLLFTPACAFSAWGDHSSLADRGHSEWGMPSMPDHYLRSNAFYALKARGEIPVAQEVPEEPRPDFGDPSEFQADEHRLHDGWAWMGQLQKKLEEARYRGRKTRRKLQYPADELGRQKRQEQHEYWQNQGR